MGVNQNQGLREGDQEISEVHQVRRITGGPSRERVVDTAGGDTGSEPPPASAGCGAAITTGTAPRQSMYPRGPVPRNPGGSNR